jgi:hypothetical protein
MGCVLFEKYLYKNRKKYDAFMEFGNKMYLKGKRCDDVMM